jgi:pyruvate/2-oxoglutarate dehydrogenase complex dihydrolipoamide dehydrogenase (E3) component
MNHPRSSSDRRCCRASSDDGVVDGVARGRIVGRFYCSLIQGYVVAMNLETTEEERMHTLFPHPTLSEMMKEAVLDACG